MKTVKQIIIIEDEDIEEYDLDVDWTSAPVYVLEDDTILVPVYGGTLFWKEPEDHELERLQNLIGINTKTEWVDSICCKFGTALTERDLIDTFPKLKSKARWEDGLIQNGYCLLEELSIGELKFLSDKYIKKN